MKDCRCTNAVSEHVAKIIKIIKYNYKKCDYVCIDIIQTQTGVA